MKNSTSGETQRVSFPSVSLATKSCHHAYTYAMFLITPLFISMPVEVKPRKMAIFCDSFHASSYYMSTETASALMFKNFEKCVNRSSIFNKVPTIDLQLYYKWIPSKALFKVFNHTTESEMYSDGAFCENTYWFLTVNYFRKRLRLTVSDRTLSVSLE